MYEFTGARILNYSYICSKTLSCHLTFEQIISDLKNKVYHPVYFLTGEEPYFIDEISDYIAEHVLDETEKEFNQTVLYGRDIDVDGIISEAKRFPMMANHQVVIIKEAQTIKNIENLAPYLEQPLRSTLLVICYKYKKLDGRKKFTKDVAKNGVLFESRKLYENKVQGWIAAHLKEDGYKITPPALVMLTEYLGSDLGTIANELEKLMVNIPKGSEIDADNVEANIGISKEFNRFELQKALGTKNVAKANQIINYFASNPNSNPAVLTISSLVSYFSKLVLYHKLPDKSKNNVASMLKVNPYFVGEYEIAARNYQPEQLLGVIENLRVYDMRSKGVENVSVTGDELVKELVYKILH